MSKVQELQVECAEESESEQTMRLNYTTKYSQAYCDFVNALADFEEAHRAYMDLSVFTPEGKAAKQYMHSASFRYLRARRIWELEVKRGCSKAHTPEIPEPPFR